MDSDFKKVLQEALHNLTEGQEAIAEREKLIYSVDPSEYQ